MSDFWSEFSSPVRWSEYDHNGRAKPATAKVHTNTAPQIANSVIGMKIEASMRARLGPCPNVKGDRPPASEDEA